MRDGDVMIAVTTMLRRPVRPLLHEIKSQMPGADILVVLSGVTAEDEQYEKLEIARRELGITIVLSDRGYSIARNSALEAAEKHEYLIFFDDDQLPDAGCFTSLLAIAKTSDFDVVLGLVDAAVHPHAWVRAHDVRPRRPLRSGAYYGDANSGNTLIRLSTVRRLGLQFDQRFNSLGGEDTDFFRRLRARGGKFYFCRESRAVESTGADRQTLGGRFRVGFRMSLRASELNGRNLKIAMRRAGRLGFGLALLLIGIVSLQRHLIGRAIHDIGFGIAYLWSASRSRRAFP